MKSNTYELHNYADLDMELDSAQIKPGSKRKASNATGSRRGEKYSLRQKRQKRQPDEPASPTPAPQTELEPAAAAQTPSASKGGKSSAKTKAPPLSKYRRKTANARERTRMREINTAFETLRECVPQSITGEDAASTNEKLTKITTLRLAMKYIEMLSASLQDPSYESEFLVECLRESANREAHVRLDTEPEAELDLDMELELEQQPAAPVKPAKKQAKGNKKSPAKRQSKQAKAVPATKPTMTTTSSAASSSPESCYASSSVGSPAFCVAASSPSSAYASLSSSGCSSSSGSVNGSAPLDADSLLGMQAFSELNTLLLESDSESLHCLNPNYHSLLASGGSVLPSRGDLPISMNSTLDKPDVELSLRLLDHSTDSFDFASDQQPSACISPLATLDSFHPFADLLHGEFPDIFLT